MSNNICMVRALVGVSLINASAFAEAGNEKCARLEVEYGLDRRACEDAVVGSDPNSQAAQEILENRLREDLEKRRSYPR